MKDNGKSSFSGLPTAFVKEILGKGEETAERLFVPYDELTKKREQLRRNLLDTKTIASLPQNVNLDILTTCGISGFCSWEPYFTSGIAFSAAFAVEGIIQPSGKQHWPATQHQSFLSLESNPDSIELLHAIRSMMTVELGASAPHDIIFVGDSLIDSFVGIMESLKPALEVKDTPAGKEYLARLKTAILGYKTILEQSDGGRTWIGAPSSSAANEFQDKLGTSVPVSGSTLFTMLLAPGEFTVPAPVDQGVLVRVRNIAIKDETLASIRDSFSALLGKTKVVYYRPRQWTPAFRLEIDSSTAGNPERVVLLLNSVAFQCITPGFIEPYPLCTVRRLAASAGKAVPALRQSMTAFMTNAHRTDLGELFPLILSSR